MSKKLQCQDCGQAEYGEDLYNYDGEILCRYCIVARVYEGSTPCEHVGTCNDKTYPNKTEEIDQLKQQLAEKDCRIEELEGQFAYECECNKQLVELQKQLAIQELEKVKVDLRAKLHLLESGYLRHFVAWQDICDQINKQINELKGE